MNTRNNTNINQILAVLLLSLLLPLAMSGCNKKLQSLTCKQDSDCRITADGKEISGVCHMGKCEECVENTDCQGLKQCRNNRCESTCQVDADCGTDKHCEDSFCMANCSDNSLCGTNSVCTQGRCVAQGGDVTGTEGMAGDDCKSLSSIHFDFDRFDIKDEYKAQVDQLARCLEANPTHTVTVEGHTDDRGTPVYNMVLGEKRATSVVSYLKQNKGIAATRLKAVSFGEQKPLISEKNEYAWQQNRRAQFSFTN